MRLRIHTPDAHTNDHFPITGAQLKVTLAGSNDGSGRELLLDGVQSVTIHCAGRKHPVTAVLVVRNVHLDIEADMQDEAMAAALRLAGTEE
jgi:hypothetical protein